LKFDILLLHFLAEKIVFLILRRKNEILPLLPFRKYRYVYLRKNPLLALAWKKSFRRHDQGRTQGGVVNPPLELDISQKLYYLRQGD